MSNLKDIKSEIKYYANDPNLTELQIVENHEKHYFDGKDWFKINRLTFSSFQELETELENKTWIEYGI